MLKFFSFFSSVLVCGQNTFLKTSAFLKEEYYVSKVKDTM